MSQIESTFGVPDAAAQRTSGLAIGSLVCSLIVCCPITTIVGPLLGIAALVKIGGNPALKGRGIALAAILMGVVFTAAQTWGGYGMWQVMKPVFEGPNVALTAGFGGDTAAFKAAFHGAGATAGDADVTAFIDELRQRYGAYQSCRYDETARGTRGAFGDPVVPFPYILTFDNAEVRVEAKYVFADEGIGWVQKWGSITVFDPDLGDLTYPPAAKSGGEGSEDADEDAAAEGDPETGDGG